MFSDMFTDITFKIYIQEKFGNNNNTPAVGIIFLLIIILSFGMDWHIWSITYETSTSFPCVWWTHDPMLRKDKIEEEHIKLTVDIYHHQINLYIFHQNIQWEIRWMQT